MQGMLGIVGGILLLVFAVALQFPKPDLVLRWPLTGWLLCLIVPAGLGLIRLGWIVATRVESTECD